MTITEAISTIESAGPHPETGFPCEVFDFLGRNMPMTNVDLLIRDQAGRTLFTWRADERYGPGWHLPGGVIRYKELAANRVREVARDEVGAEVEFEPEPIFIAEAIVAQRARGHSISLLYRCRLVGEPTAGLRASDPPQSGQWRWHDRWPDVVLPEHSSYARFF
jgi:ADP-ribose pyrophosphatase YjhB (NUDIX family)